VERAGGSIHREPRHLADGRRVAFSIERRGRKTLYAMNADGTEARAVTESLELRGTPAWAPDGRAIASVADEDGAPRLFRVSLESPAVVRLVREYSVDPTWSPDGRFIVYSGPDIGTSFPVRAVTVDAAPTPCRISPCPVGRGASASGPDDARSWRCGERASTRTSGSSI
jgi:Tol biopolymer transport system component